MVTLTPAPDPTRSGRYVTTVAQPLARAV